MITSEAIDRAYIEAIKTASTFTSTSPIADILEKRKLLAIELMKDGNNRSLNSAFNHTNLLIARFIGVDYLCLSRER